MDYALYFGRFSEEKGIGTLIKVCKELPDVQFIFAGTGPLEDTINGVSNIKNVEFQRGEALEKLIREARFSIYPSEWYENCPFSVMEWLEGVCHYRHCADAHPHKWRIYTKELWIDRRENSKSLAWSSVLLALGNVKEVGAVVDRPKALGDIRGVTYIYGMFYRFGVIDVPDDAKCKMNRCRCVSKG